MKGHRNFRSLRFRGWTGPLVRLVVESLRTDAQSADAQNVTANSIIPRNADNRPEFQHKGLRCGPAKVPAEPLKSPAPATTATIIALC
jgi:hypothetical protein